jgi:hypothetical protein
MVIVKCGMPARKALFITRVTSACVKRACVVIVPHVDLILMPSNENTRPTSAMTMGTARSLIEVGPACYSLCFCRFDRGGGCTGNCRGYRLAN